MNRCVLLSGPAGSGKTTVCRLGQRAMLDAWGVPAAAIDVDDLYAIVDPRWELDYDDDRNAMILGQAAYLAGSLFQHGWPVVMICGNSLFDPADVAILQHSIGRVAAVHHVTLTPDPAVTLRRCAGGPDRDPPRLLQDAELFSRKVHPGSVRLDNTALAPGATLAAIVRLVGAGAGLLETSAETRSAGPSVVD